MSHEDATNHLRSSRKAVPRLWRVQMKSGRQTIILLLLSILCSVLLDQNGSVRAEAAGEKKGKKIVFQWAFCTLRKADGAQKPKVAARKTVLKSGDKIKFFLKRKSPCHLYLIHQNSQHRLKLLYPLHFRQAVNQDTWSDKQYIPDGNRWYELDEHTGKEKFYLLASIQPLSDLENMFKRYTVADKADRLELADQITGEIQNLRKRHLKFKTYSEKPVTNPGKSGSGDKAMPVHTKDIADYAVEISTTIFFSRTYTVDHRQR